MKMFDWDDHEIASILWGEGGEAGDHIVPYTEGIEKKGLPDDYRGNDKETQNEEDANTNGTGNNPTPYKLLQDKSDTVFTSGTAMDPQLNSPSFGTSNIDDNLIVPKRQTLRTYWSGGSMKIFFTAKETELDICTEVSGNQQEQKELAELVGNSWANIASFDDLHRIFSNDELDGHTSLGSADELWSSSKDLVGEVAKSSSEGLGVKSWEFGASGNISPQIDLKSEYSHNEYTASTSALIEKKDNEYGAWPSSSATISHYNSSLRVPVTAPTFPSGLRSQPHVSGSLAHPHVADTYVAPLPPYAYRNYPQQYSSTHMLKPTNNKPVETTARTKKMTPQEKIEKLRRRQQMRARLAIQKQQQQLSHQTSCVEFPRTQKSGQDKQFLQMEKAETETDESLSNLSYCDPGSPYKKDKICLISDMDEYSAGDTVLYHLQDTIKRLDTKTRLCIKDSLYRLAHSATQRHYASDINAADSRTFSQEIAKEETGSRHRIAGNANLEIETNHIDRAVAHLLFHHPVKFSVKHAEKPESSTSKRVCSNRRIAGNSLQCGFLASEKNCNLTSVDTKTLQPFVDSCMEDMQDMCHEEIVNPQKEKI